MNWIKRIFGSALAWLSQYFRSGKAAADAKWALDHLADALPFIDIAASVAVTLTPTAIDDLAWAAIKAKFPKLFDGSVKTGDELKLYMLALATELFKAKYPQISTSVARATVQLAYIDKTAV
jgi:hypothetical protein